MVEFAESLEAFDDALRKKDYDLAKSILLPLLTENLPLNIRTRRARLNRSVGAFRDAIRDYRFLAHTSKNKLEYYVGFAHCALKLNESEAVLKLFLSAPKSIKSQPEFRFWMARTQHARGQWAKAIQCFERCKTTARHSDQLVDGIADCLIQLNRTQHAIELLEDEIEKQRSPLLIERLMFIHLGNSDLKKAIELFDIWSSFEGIENLNFRTLRPKNLNLEPIAKHTIENQTELLIRLVPLLIRDKVAFCLPKTWAAQEQFDSTYFAKANAVWQDGQPDPTDPLKMISVITSYFKNSHFSWDLAALLSIVSPASVTPSSSPNELSSLRLVPCPSEIFCTYVNLEQFLKRFAFGFQKSLNGLTLQLIALLARENSKNVSQDCRIILEKTWQNDWLVAQIGRHFDDRAKFFTRYADIFLQTHSLKLFLSPWLGSHLPDHVKILVTGDKFPRNHRFNQLNKIVFIPHGQLWYKDLLNWNRTVQTKSTMAKVIKTALAKYLCFADYLVLPQPIEYFRSLSDKQNIDIDFSQLRTEARNISEMVLLPGGYHRLDYLVGASDQNVGRKGITVLIAPQLDSDEVDRRIWLNWHFQLFEKLLATQAIANIIFRAGGADTSDLKNLVSDKRVSISHQRDYRQEFARADLLISNGSSQEMSFSLGLLKPVINIDPANPEFLEHNGGVRISNAAKIEEAIHSCNVRKHDIKTSLATFRQNNFALTGQTVAKLTDYLNQLLAEKIPRDHLMLRNTGNNLSV